MQVGGFKQAEGVGIGQSFTGFDAFDYVANGRRFPLRF
jgi:hypothetical protein